MACSDPSGPGPAQSVTYVSGDAQEGVVGEQLSEPLTVRVVDAESRSVPGVDVSWSVEAEGGTVTALTAATDANGLAQATWRLGPSPGTGVAKASVAGLTPVRFTATAEASKVISYVSGDAQEGVVGEQLSEPLTVRVLDTEGRPAPGVDVNWSVEAEGGTIAPLTVATDADGFAQASWRLGTSPGTGVATAGVAGLTPVRFTATANAGEPASLRFSSDSVEMVADGATLLLRPTLQDRYGNPLPDAPLQWSSSDVSIATVDDTGLVTSGSPGSVSISATTGPMTTSIAVRTSRLVSVTTGGLHSCGLTESGRAFCWGFGEGGELGNGDTLNASTPVAVAGDLRFRMINAGNWHTCGITLDGEVYCWGENGARRQELRPVSEVVQPEPTLVTGTPAFAGLDAGSALHTCAWTTDGQAYCWGYNEYGQLGDGTSTEPSEVPVPVAGGLRFRVVRAGGQHTCGLTQTGVVYCWGYNSDGQLGIGVNDEDPHPTPLPVDAGPFIRVGAGGYAACAIDASDAAYCWGWDLWGQIGDGPPADTCVVGGYDNPCRTRPSLVSGGLSFTEIEGGDFHTCGLTVGGIAYCWGSNGNGQLGDGTSAEVSDVPVILTQDPLVSVSPGGVHTCAIRVDGRLYCTSASTWPSASAGVHDALAETLAPGSSTHPRESRPPGVSALCVSVTGAGAIGSCR